MRKVNKLIALSIAASALSMTAIPALAASEGQALYAQHCAMCHGADGKGAMPGVGDFTKHGGVLSESDVVLMRRTLDGYKSMPAMKDQLSAKQVHQILIYMHKAFGG